MKCQSLFSGGVGLAVNIVNLSVCKINLESGKG